MKKLKIGGAVAAVFLALSSWASSLEVTDVKIAQRYPWNGLVDITYTVTSDDPNKDVWVYPVGYDADKDTSVALMPQYLSGEGASNAVHQGTHQMTWNMAAQMGKDYNRAAFSVKLHAFCDAAPYMVIDLSAGSEADKYEVSYLPEIPEGGWTDEPYKTTKMVFRLILPGTFLMGSPVSERESDKRLNGIGEDQHLVTLTKPFYCSVFEMTKAQRSLITGGISTSVDSSCISYYDLRGRVLGAKWPHHHQVDADSLVGKLRLRTGVTIDLPTEAQWEYACRAGTDTAYNDNSANCPAPSVANAWGLYGMHTGVAEWCLDGADVYDASDNIDPKGANSSFRPVVRGATYTAKGIEYNRSAARYSICRLTSSNNYVYFPERSSYCDAYASVYCGARLVALPACQ